MKDYDNSRLDERLKQALLQAARRDYEELLAGQGEEKIVWSTQYLRRRRKMLRNPDRYLRASLRPGWKKVLHVVSVALVALCLAAGAVLFNPTARAQLMQFFMKMFGTYSDLIMNEPDPAHNSAEMAEWTFAWMPEGFEEVAFEKWVSNYTYSYSDGKNFIYLDQTPATSEYRPQLDNEHATVSNIKINKARGTLFTAVDEGGLNYVFWIEEADNTAFLLYGNTEPEVLMKMAESLEKK